MKQAVRKRRGRLAAVFVILIILTLYFVISAMQITSFGKRDETRPADVIIVLGSMVRGELPSPAFLQRILAGIRLYEEGYADFLLFTGGKTGGQSVAEADAAKNYAIAAGVPEEAILLENRSVSTYENLYYAGAVMQEHRLSSALVVSDPLHLMRAMQVADDLGIEAYSSPVSESAYRGFFAKTGFLLREVAALTAYRIQRIFTPAVRISYRRDIL